MQDRPLAFRLPEPLVTRIDAYAERMARDRGQLRPNRAEALRELVTLGLNATGKQSKRRGRRH